MRCSSMSSLPRKPFAKGLFSIFSCVIWNARTPDSIILYQYLLFLHWLSLFQFYLFLKNVPKIRPSLVQTRAVWSKNPLLICPGLNIFTRWQNYNQVCNPKPGLFFWMQPTADNFERERENKSHLQKTGAFWAVRQNRTIKTRLSETYFYCTIYNVLFVGLCLSW